VTAVKSALIIPLRAASPLRDSRVSPLSPVGRSSGESRTGGALISTSRAAGSIFIPLPDFSEPLEVFL
jgi:hypothetical protein